MSFDKNWDSHWIGMDRSTEKQIAETKGNSFEENFFNFWKEVEIYLKLMIEIYCKQSTQRFFGIEKFQKL